MPRVACVFVIVKFETRLFPEQDNIVPVKVSVIIVTALPEPSRSTPVGRINPLSLYVPGATLIKSPLDAAAIAAATVA